MIVFARNLSLLGYFGLLALILVWNAWVQPPAQLPRALVLIIMLAPLLFPLRGLLHGRAYTHAWTAFLALLYFSLGVANAANADTRIYGILEIVASVSLFIGCVLYARAKGRQEKLRSIDSA